MLLQDQLFSLLTVSLFFSQKLCRMKHAYITAGRSSMLISIALLSTAHLAFKRPKAHSITFLALHKFSSKYCSCLLLPPLGYSFIRYGIRGYARSPYKKTGMGSSPSRMHCGQGGICPVFNNIFNLELAKMQASYTHPGHFTTMSIKQYL